MTRKSLGRFVFVQGETPTARAGEKPTVIPRLGCDPFRDPFSGLPLLFMALGAIRGPACC
jgi:hypothetical protein